MIKISAVLGLAILATTTVSADARDRFNYRFFAPWHDRDVYVMDDSEDDVAYYEEDPADDEDVIVLNRRSRVQPRADEGDIWWMEDGARTKLEQRKKLRKPVRKVQAAQVPVKVKPKSKPVMVSTKGDRDVQTASIAKPESVRPVSAVKPKAKTVAAKPVASKTIGCTAGAAVVTGYGFGEVKPKACTGSTYAYSAARAGKNYEIKLTAASGEIIDVKKMN